MQIKKTSPSTKLELWYTSTGKYFLPNNADGDLIIQTIKNNYVFDEAVYKAACKFIKKDTIVLDLGANFGQMSILMAKHVGKLGNVYAFEANKFVYSVLKKNIAINDAHVTPYFGAVYSKSGETLHFPQLNFERFACYGSYGLDYTTRDGVPVTSVAIDDLTFPGQISFMKIDLQGSDLFALHGATKTIKKHKMAIIVEYEKAFEHECGYSLEEFAQFIKYIDYKVIDIIDNTNYLLAPNM
ncbi:FkbM family methyltransferase [Desulfovibrio sp. OttesenSCG-928-C06]|nr:FkbM family methyltransferase [Desulfovibrio sp. OttesenSCG-928-C06]